MPGPRHREGLVFRPDWENVVTPVVDFAERLPDVDSGRIALLGISMGGILAPRAAAFEHRLAALVAVDGLYDLGETSVRNIPGPGRRRSGCCARRPPRNSTPRSRRSWRRTRSPAGRSTTACTFKGQPEQLFDHLTCPRTLMVFTAEEGAGAHCHPGAMRLTQARIYDWLDETLAAGA
ncbi:alpha/beta fold hydrolase [Kitasatospora purpeofusca]|uniref:alpha/beta fold hydrolase n=1 Tax=Kitasatospora purpeofusca TaxID=67352 RepID=UPI0036611044